MAKGSTTIPLTNLSGSVSTPAVAIPDSASGGEIVVTGSSVNDPTVRISIMFDLSVDGGQTWASTSPSPATDPYPGIVTVAGGPTTPRGAPLTQFDIARSFPSGTNRKVRVIFIFDGNPFNGQAAVNWT